MLEAHQESILHNCISVSVSVTPCTRRISASAASSKASCDSSGISNGSLRNGLCQLSINGCSSTMVASRRFANAEALAIDTACAAQAATPSRVSRSVEANPQAPFANTRIPSPIDSDCANVPICPFFVVKSRCRKCITRTSAYFAPRSFATSRECVAKSHIRNICPTQRPNVTLIQSAIVPQTLITLRLPYPRKKKGAASCALFGGSTMVCAARELRALLPRSQIVHLLGC